MCFIVIDTKLGTVPFGQHHQQSLNHGNVGEKPKLHHGGPSVNRQGRIRGSFKKQPFLNPKIVYSEFTGWMTASPHWSSLSRTFSKLLRVNLGEASGSKATWSCPSFVVTALSMIIRALDCPMSVPPHISRRPYPARVSSGIRLYTQSCIWDRRTTESSLSDSTKEQLTKSNPTNKNRKVPLADNTLCTSLKFHVFY